MDDAGGTAAGADTVAERADTFDEVAAGMFEEGSTVAGRERLSRSRTVLHHQVVLLLLVVEEDSRWHSVGLDIEVGWCDSLEVGRMGAIFSNIVLA